MLDATLRDRANSLLTARLTAGFAVLDSAANVSSYLDGLQGLVTASQIASIALNDGGTPTLTDHHPNRASLAVPRRFTRFRKLPSRCCAAASGRNNRATRIAQQQSGRNQRTGFVAGKNYAERNYRVSSAICTP